MARPGSSSRFRKALLGLFVAALFVAVFRRSWVCDDAFITMRTVDNLVHGRGLVWNVGFRVQTFTHPLWLAVVTPFYAAIGQPFVALIVPSLLATASALWLLFFRIARSTAHATVAFVALVLARSFLDFGTSGLENPLLHLLLALVVLGLDADEPLRARRTGLALSLLAVARIDAVFLVAPAFLVVLLPELRDPLRRRRGLATLAWTALPFVAWTAFSVVYFGVPFPNTAYAKLFAHHGTLVELGRAGRYALSHLTSEPFTLALPFVGIGLGFLDRDPRTRALAVGIAIHLVYLVNVGGDFMLGRFLTPPLFVAVLALARSSALPASLARVLPVVLVFAALAVPEWNAPPRPVHNGGDEFGIADERDHWGPDTRLAAFRDGVGAPRGIVVDAPRMKAARASGHVVSELVNTAGFNGFYSGPGYHIIDIYGLSEGYAARMPAVREIEPRAGHNFRFMDTDVPRSFQSVIDGGPFVCAMTDRAACALLRDTILAEHAPLFDGARWGAIVRLNTGYHRGRIDVERYRRPYLTEVQAAELATPRADGTSWNAAPSRTFTDSGIRVRFPRGTRADGLAFSADRNDCLRIVFRDRGRDLGELRVPQITEGRGLLRRARALPVGARGRPFDEVFVEPTCGDHSYSLGYIAPITRSSNR